MRVAAWVVSLLIAAGLCSGQAQAKEAKMVRVQPRESEELLANPGMGWQTFHHFADDDKNLAGLPSGAAYFRFWWRDLEPTEGKIEFGKVDELLAHAHRAGQKLGFRIMIAASDQYMGAPDWLKQKGCKGFEYHYEGGGTHWVPDFDDPLFREAHLRLIREMGRRYDGHPDLDYVDIGSVGLWGEWHMSGTGIEVPPLKTRLEIIEAYLQAFPKTPKLMLIGDKDGMKYATSRGCGWRADCLGDMGGFSPCWNHMHDAYPEQIEASGSQEAWKTGPVAWESCWDMRKWVAEGWDVRYIFDYGLDYHCSYINNKSAPIPEGTRGEVERLIRKLGYRLVLRSLEHEESVSAGGALSIKMDWENVGVAPPYRDHRVAFRLTDAAGKTAVIVTDSTIKGWLPGKVSVAKSVAVPAGAARGNCQVAVGVVDPMTKEPAVCLAIGGRGADGWYLVSSVEVR